MTEGMQRDIGRLEARADNVEADLKEVKADVKAILEVVNNAKGGVRTLIIVGTISGAVGAFLGKLFPFLNLMPR